VDRSAFSRAEQWEERLENALSLSAIEQLLFSPLQALSRTKQYSL